MKVGLLAANAGHYAGPAAAAELGRVAEAAGFDSLWTAEHVLWPEGYASEYPYAEGGKMPGSADTALPDPLIWLTWVAAHTTTIKLATGILIVPHRNPGVLAKELATLDSLAGGRVLLGIGVGWLEEEFDALGVPFAGRGARTDEYIAVMRALWASDRASHSGKLLSFSDMTSNPKPAGGSVPIVVGGHSRASARRAGTIGDGFIPLGGDVPALIDEMRQVAAAAGRDPAMLEVTATHDGIDGDDPQAALDELATWGVHRAVKNVFRLGRGDLSERCQLWADKLGLAPPS
jgi:probable F420-dependent oxidoreductase